MITFYTGLLSRKGRQLLALLVLSSCGDAGDNSPVSPTPVPAPAPAAGTTFTNPLLPSGADPWVYQQGNTYYYLNTTYTNLRIWKTNKMSDLGTVSSTLAWAPPASGPASGNLWAPELYHFDNKWYLYYSAGPAGTDLGQQRTWVLENSAADPTTGTWTDKGRIFCASADFWAIDGTVLEQNGKRYFIWSGHNGVDAVQRLYISLMSNPWTLTGPRVELSHPEYSWEMVGLPYVNEGPEILQHGGKTFLVYSASFCGTDYYSLGMLTADATADPMLLASWTKSTKPVFSQSPASRAYATGHNGFFKSKDGTQDWLIYHANSSAGQGCYDTRNPRMQVFTWNPDGMPNFGTPVGIHIALTKPSGE
ncbi:family 43 glycosylhydrolase [Hymenobacter sp. NBH84]|uniref:glycoside hydrolase family 43 protein n=1 Tax=Hymenobacter sp. NBH84 TaxID=2596915 RepID=UPI001623B0DE|nr:glycoside hydrolase family 43 protein [Hymenobacter sp. NBH84]QNE38637.1 family 43 glycosylhydrolase [Hymenobacter sp. NBH84]